MRAQDQKASNDRRRVAVIAVHGVADQQPKQTARTIARLLAGLRRGKELEYLPPVEVPILVGVRRPEVQPPPITATAAKELKGKSFIQPSVRVALAETARPEDGVDLGRRVLHEQLAKVDLPPEDEVWESVRLEAQRRNGNCEAHIYEMYWADLSRLGNRLYSTLLGLYQLFFFLPVLGSRTLAFARACVPGGGKGWIWRLWGGSNALATRLLSWGVPILNLLLLTLVAFVAFREVEHHLALLVPALPPLIALALTAALFYRTREHSFWNWLPWPGRLAALTLVVASLFAFWQACGRPWETWIAAMTLWLAAVVGVHMLLRAYDQRLPGALLFSRLAILVFFVAVLEKTWSESTSRELLDAVTELTSSSVVYVHWALWGGFALVALFSMLCGLLAIGTSPAEKRPRLWRAAWTVDLSLVFSAPAILALDLAVWAALLEVADRLLVPRETGVSSVLSETDLTSWREILFAATPPFWLVWMSVLGFAVVVTLWAIWPAVRADAHRRRRRDGLRRQRDGSSPWIGTTLTSGFKVARWMGELVRALVVLGLPYAAYWHWTHPVGLQPPLTTRWSVLVLGTVLAAVVLGRGPLAFLALGFRAALDIAFDVLNWLRSDPPKQTPSGRILSRYHSLMRHVQESGYDAVVIVAHSQGTVITAEGLRLWRHLAEKSPERVHLLTMGAPLHELYGLRFPFRYAWARSGSEAWNESTANSPSDLGVESWTNVYHSGDYVGRTLWHPASAASGDEPWDEDKEFPAEAEPTIDRRELCLGAGGHNTYWDGHSPRVAQLLDELIERACQG